MRTATSGLRLRNARKSRRSSTSSSQRSIARTVALRGLSESSATSPNTSPGPHHVEHDVVALGRGGERLEPAVDHHVELRARVALVEQLLRAPPP